MINTLLGQSIPIKTILRKFFKWLKKTEDYPEEVKWLKSQISKHEQKLPGEGELLTEDDIKKVLAVNGETRKIWLSDGLLGNVGRII